MPNEQMKTDVVVIGYGSAGATAAITAHDNGANVIMLEKMSELGGNSRASAGNITVAENNEDYTRYLETVCFNVIGKDLIDKFVEGSAENIEWIRSLGGEVRRFFYPEVSFSLNSPDITFPRISGGERLVRYCVDGPEATGGHRLIRLLSSNVEHRGIKVMMSTPAKELIQNEKGEIVGVIAESEGKPISIEARKGVIMACGGFENDPILKWENLPCKPTYFYGTPGNTGDGIRMAEKVGASIWHMNSQASSLGFKAPGFEAAFYVNFLAPGFFDVDRDGKRFVDETSIDSHEYWKVLSYFDTSRFIYPRIPIYAILSEEVIRRGPMVQSTCGYNLGKYKWSLDNSAEVKKGWIRKAKTIPELVKQMSHMLADASVLENTITRYNEFCRAGNDADFGRHKESLKAIEAPYYAMELWPALINTQGGPHRDKEARVLDPYNKPIPRLYAAGELGSIWGFLYQTATNVAEALVFGRIAGRNAAMNPPLEE